MIIEKNRIEKVCFSVYKEIHNFINTSIQLKKECLCFWEIVEGVEACDVRERIQLTPKTVDAICSNDGREWGFDCKHI